MFGIGGTELFLILLFAFMIFGPDKLPGMGRTIGRALRQFKQAQEGFTQVVQSEVLDPAAEAMNASAGKPNRKRAAELDEDADLEGTAGEDGAAPRRTETFAERKKRLAAEKAARDAEAAAAAAEAAAAEAEKTAATADAVTATLDPDSDDDVTDAAGSAPTTNAVPAAGADDSQSKPVASKPSAADLYSMKRPSRSESAVSGEDSPAATREASEAQSAERGAGGAVPAGDGATPDDEKEA